MTAHQWADERRPVGAILRRGEELFELCDFDFELHQPKDPNHFSPITLRKKDQLGVRTSELLNFVRHSNEPIEATPSTENPAKALADLRHKPTAPAPADVTRIVQRIKAKADSNKYWHQSVEIDAWLEENPDTKTTKERLRPAVNKALNVASIPPKRFAPQKN